LGFKAGQSYLIQWWDPYETEPGRQALRTEHIVAQADQTIELRVNNLLADLAVTIQPTDR
jgi:hypothetical protein